MSKFESARTKSGIELPLMDLKGKAYMMVCYRLLWLNEDVVKFTISTEFPVLTDEQAVARATVHIYDEAGNLVKSSTATKRETKKDFPDFTEKAETGAIGRAVTLLGFGTQFALADLDEGSRIVDSPLAAPVKAVSVRTEQPPMTTVVTVAEVPKTETGTVMEVTPPKKTSFRKPSTKKEEAVIKSGGWD